MRVNGGNPGGARAENAPQHFRSPAGHIPRVVSVAPHAFVADRAWVYLVLSMGEIAYVERVQSISRMEYDSNLDGGA